jgi:hypothetical protein
MSGLAFNGARDFAGHKLCRPCWDGITIRGKHACDQGKCECPCRLMEKEAARSRKKDHSAQIQIEAGTITV